MMHCALDSISIQFYVLNLLPVFTVVFTGFSTVLAKILFAVAKPNPEDFVTSLDRIQPTSIKKTTRDVSSNIATE